MKFLCDIIYKNFILFLYRFHVVFFDIFFYNILGLFCNSINMNSY